MTSGRAEIAQQGGHVICRQEPVISEIRSEQRESRQEQKEMWNRLFKDNGVKSIQTSLAEGAAHFKAVDEKIDTLRVDVIKLSAHVATLADVVKQGNDLQHGLAEGELTIEGIARKVLKQLPKTGTTGSAMWVSLAVVAICATIVFVKIWGAL